MPDEVAGHLVESLLGGDDVVVTLEFPLKLLCHVDVGDLQVFDDVSDPLVQVAYGHAEFLAPGVVVERDRGFIVDRPLEVIRRDVVAKDPPRDLIVFHQGCAGEPDVAGVRDGAAHVQGEGSVLGPVCLIGDDDDVVSRAVGLLGLDLPVELLDEGEDVCLMLCKQAAEVLAACCPAGVAVVVHYAAAGKRLVDLCVEVVAVGQHEECVVSAEFAVDLAREEDHRVALARSLGVPEDAEFSLAMFSVPHCLDGAVDAEVLVVAGEDLLWLAEGVVEEDEVLKEVHEVFLSADPLEERLHIDNAGFVLDEPLPFVEVLKTTGHRSDLCVCAVCEHDEGVVVEEVRDRVFVVLEVLFVGRPDTPVDVLQFHEEQGEAVDESHDVGPPAVEVAPDPELPDAEEVVLLRIREVKDPEAPAHQFALLVPETDLHAVAEEVVLLAVRRGHRLRGGCSDDLAHGVVVGFAGEAGVQLDQSLPEVAGQDDLAVG